MTAPEYMLKRTKNEKEYTVRYKEILTGEPRYYEMKVVGFSDTMVLQSFKDVDEQVNRELADTKDIKLSFEFGDIRNRYVYADFSRCMRIFVNVIFNAIKYTQEGGTVNVRCEQIEDSKEWIII